MTPGDPLVLAALASQEEERATGFADWSQALEQLRIGLDPLELLDLVRELRLSGFAERELSARLLVQSALPGNAVVDEVRRGLQLEDDPQVIRWFVTALQYTREPGALPDLEALSSHPDAQVRFGVPGALSSCSNAFVDVADVLLTLSQDPDRDVRWSAIFRVSRVVGRQRGPAHRC
jgi:HEAT repeats